MEISFGELKSCLNILWMATRDRVFEGRLKALRLKALNTVLHCPRFNLRKSVFS
jgi:hypothetical protein